MYMQKSRYRIVIFIVLSCLLVTTACSQNGQAGDQEQQDHKTQSNRGSMRPLNVDLSDPDVSNQPDKMVLDLIDHQGNQYVNLEELVNILNFNMAWNDTVQAYHIGDLDVVYEIKMNSNAVEKEEQNISLQHEPLTLNGKPHIPKDAISKIFGQDMQFEMNEQQLIIYQSPDEVDPIDIHFDKNNPNDGLNFEEEGASAQEEEVWSSIPQGEKVAEALARVKGNDVVRTARKYLGVPYEFGAAAYSKSRAFDCSSYVRHVYNQHGVKLPRTARNQAKRGQSVSRNNLKVGDLLYFYIPGRFKSNNVVGHVGIYIGNQRMIHAGISPKNGVQIAKINTNYWKKTFLGAKRVITG